ncbi:hypothetical protein NKR23_g1796 [Pleurostoma richardsiae]|uniref:Uncharacterized protein n=1 Tax=Pleurostoma richardsiae TaxID=41990 RepID=A0AA38VYW6_9PEZI|nr:hypothetical protein NKR23_g1796 [Pleurostoma richardsiae]
MFDKEYHTHNYSCKCHEQKEEKPKHENSLNIDYKAKDTNFTIGYSSDNALNANAAQYLFAGLLEATHPGHFAPQGHYAPPPLAWGPNPYYNQAIPMQAQPQLLSAHQPALIAGNPETVPESGRCADCQQRGRSICTHRLKRERHSKREYAPSPNSSVEEVEEAD